MTHPRLVLLLASLSFFFGGLIQNAHAMQIKPAIFDLITEPGQSVSGSFSVKNDENRPQKYFFSMQKFLPQGEAGDQTFLPMTETKGLPKWTYLSKSSVSLAPGQEERVSFAIRVPADAARGSAQEAIFVSTVPPDMKQSGIGVGIRTGMFVFLRVGAIQESHLSFVWVSHPDAWFSHLPVPIQMTIENQGGAYEIPQGEIVIRNVFGRERARILFNPSGSRVLSGSRRSFSSVWQNHPPASDQGFWTNVGEELSNGGFGSYTLSFEPTRGTLLPITKLARVFIWPIHLIILISGLIVFIGGMIFWTRRRLLRRFLKASL